MTDVFISYAHEDRPFASKLAAALQREGFKVWWDLDLKPGTIFRQVIADTIDKAAAVIMVWSSHASKSFWVLDESQRAADRGKLLPLIIDDTPLPLGFGQHHFASLRGWHGSPNHQDYLGLCEQINALATGEFQRRFSNLSDDIRRLGPNLLSENMTKPIIARLFGMRLHKLITGTAVVAAGFTFLSEVGRLLSPAAAPLGMVTTYLLFFTWILLLRGASLITSNLRNVRVRQYFDRGFSAMLFVSVVLGLIGTSAIMATQFNQGYWTNPFSLWPRLVLIFLSLIILLRLGLVLCRYLLSRV